MADKAKEGCSGESRPFNDGADARTADGVAAAAPTANVEPARECVCVCGLVRPQRRRPLTLNPIREPELNYVFQRAAAGTTAATTTCLVVGVVKGGAEEKGKGARWPWRGDIYRIRTSCDSFIVSL